MLCNFGKVPVALSILMPFAFATEPVVNGDDESSELDRSAHVSADPSELRKQSNARYVGVPVNGHVTQRFEMYDPHSEDALRELKSMGFTQVILDWPQLHKAATDLGLGVVLANWWIDKTKQEDIDKGIERARAVDPDRLIGFSVMDEPGRNSPDTPFGFYIDLYEKLKPMFRDEFPSTRLEISHWGPMASWDDRYYDYFSFLYEAADVMRIMPYPDLNEAPLDDVFFMMQRSRRMMEIAQTELPLTVILQAWILPPRNELPEIEELRVMAYQAMLSGAETLSFFEYNLEIWRKTPEFHDEFRKLMAELTSFSSRYGEYSVTSTMDDDGVLTSMMNSPSGGRRKVEVNTRREAVSSLAALQVRITVLPSVSEPHFVANVCRARESCGSCDPVHCVTTTDCSPGCRPIVVRQRCATPRRQTRRAQRSIRKLCW